jgi:very-short-patch-repair endonuclease
VAQLLDAGLSRDAIDIRARSGRLHRLYRGVYAVGHTALTQRSRELAAVLSCGRDAVLGHRSAGARLGLVRSPAWIEVTAPRACKPRAGVVVHRSRRLHPEEREVVEGIPVTSIARTLVDLAEVLDERRLAQAVQEAEVRGSFDLHAIERTLSPVPGRSGRHRLRRVLRAYQPRAFTRSEAERRFLSLCRRHGLPTPRANAVVEGYEVDFLWAEAGLAVEVDGAAFHHTRTAFHADRRRDRGLAAVGIQVVRVTWRDLEDSAQVAADLHAALDRRR